MTPNKILAAIDAAFAASPAPQTSGDIAAAVLRTLAGDMPICCDWRADDLLALANELDGALSPAEAHIDLTDTELDEMFRAWWAQSYPTPPGNHALMTHIGWARFLLEQVGHQGQQREQGR